MRNSIKASMTALVMASVVLVPAAAVVTFASADAVFAKSDKAGGKGGGKSGAAKAKSKRKSGGKSGGKSASSRGKSGRIGDFFDKLTGKDKKAARTAKASRKPAKGSGMHPSELGNMNGAMNANINAVLAHIRNGNTNGPVGHMAALAVAADGAVGAQDLLDQEAEFLALEDALSAAGYDNIDDYYAALDAEPGIEPIMDIDDAALALASDRDNPDLQLALDQALDGAGYTGDTDTALAEYEADVAGASDADLNQAISDLGGIAEEREAIIDERPTEEDVAGANDALDAQYDAEADILAYWNKNEDDPSVVTNEEQALLDKLYDRFVGNEAAIADAIGEPEADEELIDDLAECEGLEDCPDEEDTAELLE